METTDYLPIGLTAAIKNDNGTLKTRNGSDTEYAPLRAADGGTDPNSVITKGDLDEALEALPSGGGLTPVSVSTAGAHVTTADTVNVSSYSGGTTIWNLPLTSAVGTLFIVAVKSGFDWRINQAANQYINGTSARATTPGASGYLSSGTSQGGIMLICIEANKGWQMVGGCSAATSYSWD